MFTSIAESLDEEALIGQVVHNQGSPFAHFTFLSPVEQLHSERLADLLESLISRVGARGAHSLIAEVDDSAPAFAALREAGFGIYARQRIWRFDNFEKSLLAAKRWNYAAPRDTFSINLLCGSLVPAPVQQVEPTPWDALSGRVLFEEGELRAYVDLRRGPKGIWMQAFVHLDAQQFEISLAELLGQLGPTRKRPIYVCVRSYQDWLDPILRELGAEEGPLQAIMVRRTTRNVKVGERRAIIKAKGRRAEPSTPIRVPLSHIKHGLELAKHD